MAPVPPIETIKDPKASVSKITMFKNIIKNNHSCFDFFMMLAIFAATFIELLSLYLRGNVAYDIDVTKYKYLVHTYPLLMQINACIFASFFVFKIIRYKACIYTQVTTVLYSLVQFISLIFIVFKFGLYWYDAIVYPIFLYLILVLILIKLIKWFTCQ